MMDKITVDPKNKREMEDLSDLDDKVDTHSNCDDNSTGALFRLIFGTTTKAAEPQLMQIVLAVVFTLILVGQVIWALWLIPKIVFDTAIIESANLSFISLLVTAILAEVVGMTFVVVRYVFRSPISEPLDVLKELIKNNSKS